MPDSESHHEFTPDASGDDHGKFPEPVQPAEPAADPLVSDPKILQPSSQPEVLGVEGSSHFEGLQHPAGIGYMTTHDAAYALRAPLPQPDTHGSIESQMANVPAPDAKLVEASEVAQPFHTSPEEGGKPTSEAGDEFGSAEASLAAGKPVDYVAPVQPEPAIQAEERSHAGADVAHDGPAEDLTPDEREEEDGDVHADKPTRAKGKGKHK